MRKLLIDTQKLNATYLRMNLALADSISRSEAEEGQIIVMDIQESSVIGHAALKLHDGEGGFVIRSQKVKETDFIGMTLGDTIEYLDTRNMSGLPIRIIMPVVSYLTLLEFGIKPTDEITWTGGVNTVDELFLKGHYRPLVECPEAIDAIGIKSLNAVLKLLDFLPLDGPDNLNLLEKMKVYPFQIVDWMNQLALGEGLSRVFKPESDSPDGPRRSIKRLQQILQQCGKEAMDKTDGETKIHVSGYSFVSMPDNFLYRDIAFCGNFPSNNPKYGVLVWLHKKEESEDFIDKERRELGFLAAKACKTVAEYIQSL